MTIWKIPKRFICMEPKQRMNKNSAKSFSVQEEPCFQSGISVAVVGAGASGCVCGYHLLKAGCKVTLFDKNLPLRTLLPTGGGRCNFAHAEFDFRELAKNYPRGEKFLYSVFSQFSTSDTLELFKEMGIESYIQDDGRIFPESNSAKDVQETILKLLRNYGVKFEQKLIQDCSQLFERYDKVVIATGGHSGCELLKPYNINVIPQRPSLVGLNTKEDFRELSGTVVKNAIIDGLQGDILFTHFGVSGPLIYTISSVKAFNDIPYTLTADLSPILQDFQEILNSNPHKELKNILSEFVPHKLAKFLLNNIDETLKGCQIDGKTRDLILHKVHNFGIIVTGTNKGEETVTAGGIDLNEINPKTMGVKKVPNLYCIGEILNIDGFCGGFNLQNAWSTAYVCAKDIISQAE